MPRPNRRRRLTVAVAVAVAALIAPAAAYSTQATAETQLDQDNVDVWMWNVAGWSMHEGSTTNGMVDAAAASIQNRDADFAAFNELCRSQYDAIISRLRDDGWAEDPQNFSRFESNHDTGCGGGQYGNAIFSKRPLGAADRFTLPQDETAERRSVLCAGLETNPTLRFCTTHITPSNEVIDGEKINEQQLDYALALLEDYHDSGDSVVIAGDFNAQPNYGRMSGWYSSAVDTPNNSGNTGDYRELHDDDADHCIGYGEYTVLGQWDPPGPCGEDGKKIDMIFVRENLLVGDYWGDALAISQDCGGPCSDHRILIGNATVDLS